MENKNITIKVRGIILHEGKLLVVRHKNSTFMALPGGHLEYGEDVITCLERELVEELGVAPEIGKLVYINTFIDDKKDEYVEFFFEVKNGEKYLQIDHLERTHAYELAEVVWVSSGEDREILPKKLNEDFKSNKIFQGETQFIDEL
jgi:ADP-ribose pyrophosphatase YjhB (NUDIX family)